MPGSIGTTPASSDKHRQQQRSIALQLKRFRIQIPASIEVRRSGPLVAIVTGDAITDEAHRLVTSVHYEADTANLPGHGQQRSSKNGPVDHWDHHPCRRHVLPPRSGWHSFLGGGRVAYRFARGKPLSSMNDAEFTQPGSLNAAGAAYFFE